MLGSNVIPARKVFVPNKGTEGLSLMSTSVTAASNLPSLYNLVTT